MEYEIIGTPEHVDPARYAALMGPPAPVAAWRVRLRATNGDGEVEERSIVVPLRPGETLAAKLEDMATDEKVKRTTHKADLAARPAPPSPPTPPTLPARIRGR